MYLWGRLGYKQEVTNQLQEVEGKDYVIDGEISAEAFSYGEMTDSEYGYGYKINLKIDFESRQVKIMIAKHPFHREIVNRI